MSGAAFVMHVFGICHGIVAALMSVSAFSLAGCLLLPPRWSASLVGPPPGFIGVVFYVALCWVAISSRNIPLTHVALIFGTVLCTIAAVRFRWLRSTLRTRMADPATRRWLLTFCILYVLTYMTILPPAGATYLPLASAGNLDLVTYARYARQLLESGSPALNLAPFDYLRSPASVYLVAWQSLFFGRDPLTSAMPTLMAAAALFGTIAAGAARAAFGVSYRASIAIACITITSPLCRWAVASYALPAVMTAVVVVYLVGAACLAVSRRAIEGPLVTGCVAASVLLFFVGPLSPGSPEGMLQATWTLLRNVSVPEMLGWPGKIAEIEDSRTARFIVSVWLAFLPLFGAGIAYGIQRSGTLARIAKSDTDLRLTMAFVTYTAIAVVTGNMAVAAIRDPGPVLVTAAWRNLEQVNRLPFRALTLKMSDERNDLSTALASYFLSTKKAEFLGSEIELDELRFEGVSRRDPVFIHGLGCQGAGHNDVVEVAGLGCLLLAPPGMAVATPYPFNRVFLFMTYEGMTAREPGGRWNTHPTLQLNVTSDPQRAGLDRDMYLNFFVNPFLPAAVPPQRLVFRWGKNRRGDIVVAGQVWLSLPVRSEDWSGNRLWRLPVGVDFPDGRTILFHELQLTETPRGSVVHPGGEAKPR